MSRLLHSLKHRHARLMVMTRVCARVTQTLAHAFVCACLDILFGCICYLRRLHVSLAAGNEKPSASQPPIPRNRSWMAHSSDRRQSWLALTVGANERGPVLRLCKEGAEPRQCKHAQLILTHRARSLTHSFTHNSWKQMRNLDYISI